MRNRIYTPILVVIWNLLLVYVVYQIARLEYFLENADYLNYSFDVFKGGLLFDTSAILYTNALYIIIMLFPLHLKENAVWHRICKYLFVTVNSISFAINLMDSVYFQYTKRRTTTTIFSEFSNENNLFSIFGTEFLRHWYLVFLFAGVVTLLWKLYVKPQLNYHQMQHQALQLGVSVIIGCCYPFMCCRYAWRFYNSCPSYYYLKCQPICNTPD